MSVFTTVSPEQLTPWLKNYAVGELAELKGIASGIENTNYFVSTTQGEYVLTLFEKLTASELPYYLGLMDHLAQHGLPVPGPVHSHSNTLQGELNGKPATLVNRLKGRSTENPNPQQCASIGAVLAQMHLAGQTYPQHMPNPRGPTWWFATAESMRPHLDVERQQVLDRTLAEQKAHRLDHLPTGVIHADLFRDNALLDGDVVGGLIDFYFACNDVLLYDLAITVNDWCITADGDVDSSRCQALMQAYHAIRPLTIAERNAWQTLLCAAALRFWLSRLFDKYCPRPGEMTQIKDPEHFYRVLRLHQQRQPQDLWLIPSC